LRYFYVLFATLFLLSCGESNEDKEAQKTVERLKEEVEKAAVETQEKIEETVKEATQEKKDDSFMDKIGFSSKDGTISLDTNKAKDYIKEVGDDIKDKSKELSIDIKEKTLTVTKDLGIEMNKEGSLKVDTNKTKSFMKEIGDKVEKIAGDVDKFARDVINDNNSTK